MLADVLRAGLILWTILFLCPRLVQAECAPIAPIACPNCFAVVVMPDTQHYTQLETQPAGANHLDLVTRYICGHRKAWTEPTTGKTMPILMVAHLGDLVERADRGDPDGDPDAEWDRISAAFDNLDECTPNVPYVVTNGNHELQSFTYERTSFGYGNFFGASRWTSKGHGCNAPNDCDWDAGQYFIGTGDPIAAFSRNNDGDGGNGPSSPQVGRHRAALIRTPNGQPFLFLGLEQSFDFPPPLAGSEEVEGDDAAWPKQILELYLNVPTIVLHHSMLWAFPPPDTRLRWGPETWKSDSISPLEAPADGLDFGTSGGMEGVFNLLLEPYPQVRFLFTGHVYHPTHQADYTIPRKAGPPVWAFLRNFQRVQLDLPGLADRYGVGWNVVAVFDPDAEQVRVRSYRIDDVENYADPPINYDHVGTPEATECLETDQGGVGERIISWDFQVSGSPTPVDSDGDGIFDPNDNCVNHPNPDQCDSNLDGLGNLCDPDTTNEGDVGVPDFNDLRSNFGQACPTPWGHCADADFNCDGVVGVPDFNILRSLFGSSPGPSGLACAGTVPCPASACPHEVCVEGGPLHPACGSCAADVCAADPDCCISVWGPTCVEQSVSICAVVCGGVFEPRS